MSGHREKCIELINQTVGNVFKELRIRKNNTAGLSSLDDDTIMLKPGIRLDFNRLEPATGTNN